MSTQPDTPRSELLLYRGDDARTRVEVRLEGDSVWLSQRQMAELFQVSPKTISEHLQNIYDEDELQPERTVRKFRIVQSEGDRTVRRLLDHYSLEAILAVGYRVRSPRGSQFRQWASERLQDYLVKGFVLDDERLKRGPNDGYFEELLARIRDIRSSERMFWQKVLDIYATSIDYHADAEAYFTAKRELFDRVLLRETARHSPDRGERIIATSLLGYTADPEAGVALT